MPDFTIRTINSLIATQASLTNLPDAADALEEAVQGALMIAGEEVRAGKAAVAVEAVVENLLGEQLLRSVVSISVAPLAVGHTTRRFPTSADD